MFLVSSCSCLRSIHWCQVLSWEWRCSWSSADRRCSNYIWVINNFTAYQGATYIKGFTVVALIHGAVTVCSLIFFASRQAVSIAGMVLNCDQGKIYCVYKQLIYGTVLSHFVSNFINTSHLFQLDNMGTFHLMIGIFVIFWNLYCEILLWVFGWTFIVL